MLILRYYTVLQLEQYHYVMKFEQHCIEGCLDMHYNILGHYCYVLELEYYCMLGNAWNNVITYWNWNNDVLS